MNAEDIDELVFVGGCSRIPKVQELVTAKLPNAHVCKDINPDEAIACGAAIEAARKANADGYRQIALRDVLSVSLGIGCDAWNQEMSIIIPRNSAIPDDEVC